MSAVSCEFKGLVTGPPGTPGHGRGLIPVSTRPIVDFRRNMLHPATFRELKQLHGPIAEARLIRRGTTDRV